MNIYELEKLATPGPLFHDDDGHLMADGLDPFCVPLAQFGDTFSTTIECSNAALLAHCRNNYMKSLEALKEAREFICRFDDMDEGELAMAEELEKLIKELEEVK